MRKRGRSAHRPADGKGGTRFVRALGLRVGRWILAASIAVGAAACSSPTTPAEAAGTLPDSGRRAKPDSAIDPNVAPILTMRNVQFRFTKDLVVGIDRIRAQMRPVPPAQVVSFDDPTSFDLDVAGAQVRLTGPQVEVLMNTRIFAYPNANIRNLRVEEQGQSLVI